MKLIILVFAVSCMASIGSAEVAAKYGEPAPKYPAPVGPPAGASDIDKCGCNQIVGKLKKVETNLLKLILNLRNKYSFVYSELLDVKKLVNSVSWYASQTGSKGLSLQDQVSFTSQELGLIMQSIRDLTINQQSLVTKTFLTESILDLESRQGEYGGRPVAPPEGDIIYSSCDDSRITETGTYLVQDAFDEPTKVVCVLEFQPGAYTVIQNRQDGSTDFYRAYNDYKEGFGEFDGGEYWLGLDRIHNITSSGDYELFILLEDFEKNVTYARYDNFAIGSGSDFYPIVKLDGFSGPGGDSLGGIVGVLFSTFDLDLDNSESNCAASERGAWWYTDCGDSNLNGLYLKGLTGSTTGMFWSTFRTPYYSLKRSRMMVKRKQPVTDAPSTGTPSSSSAATDSTTPAGSTDSTTAASTDSSSVASTASSSATATDSTTVASTDSSSTSSGGTPTATPTMAPGSG